MDERDSRTAAEAASQPCDVCAAYRRGEVENSVFYGVVIHACKRKREGQWGFGACPCGCHADRDPGVLDRDRAIFGAAFLTALGKRIDPTTVEIDR